MMDRPVVRALLPLLAYALVATSLGAQSFMIRPTRIELQVPPGTETVTTLRILNTAGTDLPPVAIDLANLIQTPSGRWSVSEAGTVGERPATSALDWIGIDDSSVRSLAPDEELEIPLRVSPPRDARGVFFAALLAEAATPDVERGVRVRVRFLVPVIISIAGRPVRQRVEFEDVSMEFRTVEEQRIAADVPQPDVTPTTIVTASIRNDGRTYSRIAGAVRIERDDGDRWRSITRVEIEEISIMPGITLQLENDLDRRLPSGRYRLRGDLTVDGRRIAPIEREISFEGDPSARVAYDQALTLEPSQLEINVVPGALRTTVITIANPSEDTVELSLAAETPESLRGVAMGARTGESFSAAGWISTIPERLVLPGGRSRNVRLVTRVPTDGMDLPRYFADLVMSARYEDGQSAGTSRTRIFVRNAEREPEPSLTINQISLAFDDRSRYAVQTRLSNTGTGAVTPLVRVELRARNGSSSAATAMEGPETELIPLELASYAAIVDFSETAPGRYDLVVIVRFADRTAERALPVVVEEDPGAPGRRLVRVAEGAE